MLSLGPITTDRIVSALPEEVVAAFKTEGVRFWLAGGFIRAIVADEKPADVDLFVSSAEDAEKLVKFFQGLPEVLVPQSGNFTLNAYLGGNEKRRIEVSRSPNAITIRGLAKCVQIITRWKYKEASDIVRDFDFTLSGAALWWREGGPWETLCLPTFEDDVINRRLVYTQPQREEERAGSLIRLFKFYKKGYTPSLDTVAKVCARAFAYDNGDIDSILFKGTLEQAARRMPKAPRLGDYSDDGDLSVPSPIGFSAGS
jgi:hypothetical protein